MNKKVQLKHALRIAIKLWVGSVSVGIPIEYGWCTQLPPYVLRRITYADCVRRMHDMFDR